MVAASREGEVLRHTPSLQEPRTEDQGRRTMDHEPGTANCAAVGRQPSAAGRKLLAVSRKLTRPRASGIDFRVTGPTIL
jgi:hypothetical protein